MVFCANCLGKLLTLYFGNVFENPASFERNVCRQSKHPRCDPRIRHWVSVGGLWHLHFFPQNDWMRMGNHTLTLFFERKWGLASPFFIWESGMSITSFFYEIRLFFSTIFRNKEFDLLSKEMKMTWFSKRLRASDEYNIQHAIHNIHQSLVVYTRFILGTTQRRLPPPTPGLISFIFMQFLGKNWPNNRWGLPPLPPVWKFWIRQWKL